MTKSRYNKGAIVPSFDKAVTSAITSYRIEGGGNSMRILFASDALVTTVNKFVAVPFVPRLPHLGDGFSMFAKVRWVESSFDCPKPTV